jgi:predicted TIM-barrel fold metal-dependent hydrolase
MRGERTGRGKPLIIDGHIHAGYWSRDYFYGRGVEFAEIDACLEECGIDGAVLTSTDLRRNDPVIEFMRSSARLRYWFFPWVNPTDPGDLDYVRRRRADIHGIKLHPSVDRVRITDKRAKPFLEFASDNRLPVLVHCGRWQEMSSYGLALDAAALFPGADFMLSHMGGDRPDLVTGAVEGILERRLENAYLGIEGVREYWIVRQAIDRLGAERVVFGSDFPLGHPRMYLGLVEALGLGERERDLVLGGNALRILGED